MAEADEDIRAFGEFLTRAKVCKDFYTFLRYIQYSSYRIIFFIQT